MNNITKAQVLSCMTEGVFNTIIEQGETVDYISGLIMDHLNNREMVRFSSSDGYLKSELLFKPFESPVLFKVSPEGKIVELSFNKF